jgi:hypothetical protein
MLCARSSPSVTGMPPAHFIKHLFGPTRKGLTTRAIPPLFRSRDDGDLQSLRQNPHLPIVPLETNRLQNPCKTLERNVDGSSPVHVVASKVPQASLCSCLCTLQSKPRRHTPERSDPEVVTDGQANHQTPA